MRQAKGIKTVTLNGASRANERSELRRALPDIDGASALKCAGSRWRRRERGFVELQRRVVDIEEIP